VSRRPSVYDDRQITIGKLSRLCGVSIETIRYYERIGLMPRPPRTQNGRRSYGSGSLGTLTFVRRCRELGFSLDDIRALLALRASERRCSDVKTIATRHLDAVRVKLQGLREMELSLTELVATCPGDTGTECPVLDALDTPCCESRRTPA
jgi:MerR family transcriptional regulator, mercuric resistance operon regulatory protein